MNAGGQDTSKENSGIDTHGEKLVDRQQIGGTPYWIVGSDEKGYFVTFGKWQMTEPEESLQKAMDYYAENEINIILTTCVILIQDKMTEKK